MERINATEHVADVVRVDTQEIVGQALVAYDDRSDLPVLVRMGSLPDGYGNLTGAGRTVAEALERLIEHVPEMTHGNYAVRAID